MSFEVLCLIAGLCAGVLLTMAVFFIILHFKDLRQKGSTVLYTLPFDILGYGLIFFDRDERLLNANGAALQYLPVLKNKNHDRQTLKDFLNYLYDAAAEYDESLKNAIHKSAWRLPAADFREVIQWGDNQICLVEVKKIDSGETFLIMRDISELRKDEQDVLRLNQYSFKITEAIEAATNGIIIIDTQDDNYPVVFANRSFCDYLGISPDELVGERALTVMHQLSQKDYTDVLTDALRDKTPVNLELQAPGETEEAWFNVRLTPFKGEKGKPRFFVAVFTDTTELKKREAEAYQAQKLEALGKFSAGIAHDFNNILSIIQGYSHMAENHLSDKKVLGEYMKRINAATERGSGLIRQMLAFGSRKIVSKAVIDLAEAVSKQESLIRPLIGADVNFTLDCDDGPAFIEFSKDSVTQIMMNLCINARDAMPNGGDLHMRLQHISPADIPASALDSIDSEDKDTGYVCLSVQDTGYGMGEETKRNIFDPFFTTKDQGKGTGLGLSNVYGLVRQAGGHIEVQSDVGKGTTFLLYFPLTHTIPTKNLSGYDGNVENIDFKGYTALVVEDETDLLDIVVSMLRNKNMTVLKASNGNEALMVQDDHDGEIDLLLTDVVMPELNGVKLAELAQSLRPDMDVIFMSGYPADGRLAQIQLPSDSIFIAKPVAYDQLMKLIWNVLSGEKNAGSLQNTSLGHWEESSSLHNTK